MELRAPHIDLLLMHWPISVRRTSPVCTDTWDCDGPPNHVELTATWRAMEKLVDAGKVRAIGVSNFGQKRLAQFLATGPRMVPVMNQVAEKPSSFLFGFGLMVGSVPEWPSSHSLCPKPARYSVPRVLGGFGGMCRGIFQVEMHPYLPQTRLLEYCRSRQIAVTAYCPIGSPGNAATWVKTDYPALISYSWLGLGFLGASCAMRPKNIRRQGARSFRRVSCCQAHRHANLRP